MKQADIAKELGSLINQTSGVYNTASADDMIPSELQPSAPIFEIDYLDEQSVARVEALETIKFIVKSVVPNEYQDDDMITNKMKIDAFQLGMLLYHQKMNNITLQTAMDIIAKGDIQAKMFEVVEKLQKTAREISAQITTTQNEFRKYYIDSYLDLESKRRADSAEFDKVAMIEMAAEKQLGEGLEVTESGGIRVGNARDLNKELKNSLKMKMPRKKNVE